MGEIYIHDVQTERQVLLFVYLFIFCYNYAKLCIAIPWYFIDINYRILWKRMKKWWSYGKKKKRKKKKVWVQLHLRCTVKVKRCWTYQLFWPFCHGQKQQTLLGSDFLGTLIRSLILFDLSWVVPRLFGDRVFVWANIHFSELSLHRLGKELGNCTHQWNETKDDTKLFFSHRSSSIGEYSFQFLFLTCLPRQQFLAFSSYSTPASRFCKLV